MRCLTHSDVAPPSSDFDRATGLVSVPDSARDVTVVLDAGWSSLAGVHGGYMCAVPVRGAERVAPDRTVRTLTTGFLRTGVIGPLPTGGVSIDLTTHVHQPDVALGEDEWLPATFQIRISAGALAVEHGLSSLPDGTPAAKSFLTRRTATD